MSKTSIPRSFPQAARTCLVCCESGSIETMVRRFGTFGARESKEGSFTPAAKTMGMSAWFVMYSVCA